MKHIYTDVRDRPAHHNDVGVYVPGSLDETLTKMRAQGYRVLDFWRSRGSWCFKVMAPR